MAELVEESDVSYRICLAAGCTSRRPDDVLFCATHSLEWDPAPADVIHEPAVIKSVAKKRRPGARGCDVPGCGEEHCARGLCRTH